MRAVTLLCEDNGSFIDYVAVTVQDVWNFSSHGDSANHLFKSVVYDTSSVNIIFRRIYTWRI